MQSAKVAAESDVPQGSVIGHILVGIYINDCVRQLDCGIVMFACDIKRWRIIRIAVVEDNLQANINRLQKWSKDCRSMRAMKGVDAQKDFGLWITPPLKPSLHCAKVAKSALSVMYLVKRAVPAFHGDGFTKDFGTFVRPQLESAIQAWGPWAAKDINIVEKAQRRAAKLANSAISKGASAAVDDDPSDFHPLPLFPPALQLCSTTWHKSAALGNKLRYYSRSMKKFAFKVSAWLKKKRSRVQDRLIYCPEHSKSHRGPSSER
ncbi:unnamed protein product [Dibothriocephalus latus]|uniref:Reverse transcriptase domain-containing protein n=1 Tax=Dibothriocephalus latus TaxID=60516 RepID=A0A3P7LLR6_DIBLA|nr:unnamed protein product [Dibothriocephalus latus]